MNNGRLKCREVEWQDAIKWTAVDHDDDTFSFYYDSQGGGKYAMEVEGGEVRPDAPLIASPLDNSKQHQRFYVTKITQ
ncbi:hypothetical protein GZL_01422 [Streptomyces sp. 769]|nr:hypothetical protein GZL_01422 [Streptomyces sp. 769]